MNDLTDLKIAQILSYSPAIIYVCRAGGDFGATFVSANITSLFGYSQHECLDSPDFWRNNIHPDDCGRVFEAYQSFFETGHHVHEYRFRKKDGRYLWVLDEVRLIRDSQGNPFEIVGSWLDITGRKAAETALQRSEALFRDFFQANPVPTIISDPSGVIHMVNPAFTVNPGYSVEEVVGRTAQELGFWAIPADRERMVAAIKQYGFIDDLESSFFGKGNRPMTCLISSRAVELGGETRILSTVLDVTEQRKVEEAMRKLDQAKSDFISTAAHELRTPLIAIVGYSELLEKDVNSDLTAAQKESYLSIIQSNAEVLKYLVEDLLDVGRIQIGRPLGVVLKESRLSDIIDKVTNSYRLNNQRSTIRVAHDNALPETLMVDAARITQVLNNLLNNAIKYSPQGGTITVRTLTDEEYVTVSIIDQGIGMTAQQVENVFDRFYRAGDEGHTTSGLGLGMGIVKEIIAEHGGEVSVTSNPGQGTIVAFTLPRK